MIPEDLKKPKQGGRPSQHSLLLTLAEYLWCQRKVGRKASQVPAATKSSPALKKLILSLDDKFSVAADQDDKGRIPMKLSKQEVEVLHKLAANESAALYSAVARMAAEKTQGPRMAQAQESIALLAALADKCAKRLR